MKEIRVRLERHRALAIVLASILGGLIAVLLLPRVLPGIPFDYEIYMQGARLIRAGGNPYAELPFWYPLPIVLFTIVPWSFLPDSFLWAFAFIPLGLLHLHFGKRAALCWLYYPLLINVAYGQAEGWLILPLVWLLKDAPVKSAFAMMAMLFKPAYGMFLVPYRLWQWARARRMRDFAWLGGLGLLMGGAAFALDPQWIQHWLGAIARRGASPGLIERNITMWAFVERGGAWFVPLALLVAAFGLLAMPALRRAESRAEVLVVASLFVFPNGLYPVSTAMVLPFVETRNEILALVIASWLLAGLEVLVGAFGGFYLALALFALALRQRRNLARIEVNA
ncbi:MAG: hypothetical protein HY327_02160 [Chloroflexi bacterium]|nr:hypothetical protein [Chloroflexota bacterium]